MVKTKRLRSALAILLAAAMALTGPAQSAGIVRAEESVAQESAETPDVERESAAGDESRIVQTQEAEETTETAAFETRPTTEAADSDMQEAVEGGTDNVETQEATQATETMTAGGVMDESQAVTETEAGASDFSQEQQETVEETTREEGTTEEETTEEETEEETTQEADKERGTYG